MKVYMYLPQCMSVTVPMTAWQELCLRNTTVRLYYNSILPSDLIIYYKYYSIQC